MFFAHASKVKSNMSFLTACKFSQQVHSIWSWLESLDVGWKWSRNVPLNGENLLWSFSVSNWVKSGAHLAEKNVLMDHFSHVHAEWVNWLSVYLFVCLSFSTLWPNSLKSRIWNFIHMQFNPNWHEGGNFLSPCPFWTSFCKLNFYQKFPKLFGGENWHQSG